MLERSHQRLEERVAELQRAIGAIVRERGTPADLESVDAVLAFLERSALRHETDEEESLFPRLRRHADLWPLIDDLLGQHQQHRHLVAQLRTLRGGWPASGPDAADAAGMAVTVNDLARSYRRHIDREERDLIPAARDRLSATDQAALTEEMERRREDGRGEGRGQGRGRGEGRGRGKGRGEGHGRRPAGTSVTRVRDFDDRTEPSTSSPRGWSDTTETSDTDDRSGS